MAGKKGRPRFWTAERVRGKTVSELAIDSKTTQANVKRRIRQHDLQGLVSDYYATPEGVKRAKARRLGWERQRRRKDIEVLHPPERGRNLRILVHLRMDYTMSAGHPIWMEAHASEIISRRARFTDIEEKRHELRQYLRQAVEAEFNEPLASVFEDTNEVIEGVERVTATDLPVGYRSGNVVVKRTADSRGRRYSLGS